MAYVPVPKDLTKVKTKVALNLTKRQLIFFSLAAVVGIPFYLFMRKPIGSSIAAILMVTIMLPFFFMAMYEKDGLPFEKVVANIIRQKFICPSVRPYKTENFYQEISTLVKKEGVCFDIKELGKQLKKIGMLVIQDQVWNRVTMNRSAHKSTRYYVDEFHLLLKEEQTAAYSVEIWKRFRKWGGIPTGITQNIKDLLSSREIENIFENSDFIYMLNQASGDRQILAKQLNISPTQLSYVTNSNEGEGLLFYGNVIIPFVDRFPKNSLYKIMTTRLEETSEAG